MVLGGDGMLGQMVKRVLSSHNKLIVHATYYEQTPDSLWFSIENGIEGLREILEQQESFDYIINCIGILSSNINEKLHTKASGKVLIVDDECDLLEVTSSYVQDLGFKVLPASDGNLALKVVEENPDIEFLLTDIVMPGGLNGVSLAQRVKERLPDVKILYMSGFPSGVIADKSGIELDAPLITKPFSYEELVSAMDELMCEVAA